MPVETVQSYRLKNATGRVRATGAARRAQTPSYSLNHATNSGTPTSIGVVGA